MEVRDSHFPLPKRNSGAEKGTVLAFNSTWNLLQCLLVVALCVLPTWLSTRTTSYMMQDYQAATIVKKNQCHPQVSKIHVTSIHFQPVWASGITKGKTDQMCEVPVCNWLENGSSNAINVTDKCKSSPFLSLNIE